MINFVHRFRGYNSLRFVYAKGSTVRGSQLSLRFVRNPHRNEYRVAVVVSRKVNKSAVVRNRIRRRIFEVVRKQHQTRPITQPLDLVFLIYSDALATQPAQELAANVTELLEKANVW